MKKQSVPGNKRFILIAFIFFMALLPSAALFAHGGYHWHNHGWHRWYGPRWFGVYVGVPSLEIGAVVDALPYGYSTVIIGGVPYYYYEPYYYRPAPEGYVVVPAPSNSPAVTAAPVTGTANEVPDVFTINIPNSKGGYNPVTLKKAKGGGYTGPQGEFYPSIPSVKYLERLYGE